MNDDFADTVCKMLNNFSLRHRDYFMRKGCERIRSSEIGIVDKVKNLGAMVDAIAPELFCGKIRWNSYS